MKAFSNEKILLKNSVLNYQIVLYFSKHNLAIKVHEKGHTDRDEKKKMKQNKKLKKLGCKFIRINPDAENYDISVEIGKIQVYIDQSNKEKLEKEKKAEIKEIKDKLEKEKEAEIKK